MASRGVVYLGLADPDIRRLGIGRVLVLVVVEGLGRAELLTFGEGAGEGVGGFLGGVIGFFGTIEMLGTTGTCGIIFSEGVSHSILSIAGSSVIDPVPIELTSLLLASNRSFQVRSNSCISMVSVLMDCSCAHF